MKLCPTRIRAIALSISLMVVLVPWTHAQGAGGVAAGEPRFRVVRSVSGSKGSEREGRFVMEDPRTTFYIPADEQIIVYFEWDGPLGPHHFEGLWKNPEGKAVVLSDFSYEAKQKRFGGYWTLKLDPAITSGVWNLEAHIDGELAGAHSVQIVTAPKPAETGPVRRILAPSEVYARAVAASVFIDKLNSKGEKVSTASGFFIGATVVLTAFQALDGAASLRITFPNGNRTVTDQVLNWNRWGDWAMVKVDAPSPAKLAFAPPDSWSVGDRCFSLGTPAEGNRVIVDENVSGTSTFASAGQRLNLTSPPDPSSVGAPVLNEYGEVIAVAGGNVYPGMSRRGSYDVFASGILSLQSGLATPITSIVGFSPDVSPKTLAELAALNQFVPSLVEQQNLVYGRLTSKLEVKKDEYPPSGKPQTEFSKGRDPVAVLLVWSPREKVKGQIVLMGYDMNNKGVVHSNLVKLSLEKGQYSSSIFRFDPAALPLGVYRIDVLLNDDPIWRGYFHLVE